MLVSDESGFSAEASHLGFRVYLIRGSFISAPVLMFHPGNTEPNTTCIIRKTSQKAKPLQQLKPKTLGTEKSEKLQKHCCTMDFQTFLLWSSECLDTTTLLAQLKGK